MRRQNIKTGIKNERFKNDYCSTGIGDWRSMNQIGSTPYGSDGSSMNTVGNTTYINDGHGNGTSCNVIGSTTYRN